MKNTLRIAFILILLLSTAFVLGQSCCAETIPNYDDYVQCDIYVNGTRLSQPATSINGNIYIDIDTLRIYGDTSGWSFDTSNMYIKIDSSNLNIFFGDEETTAFIKANAGTVSFPLKKFKTSYDATTRYYVSLGSIAELAHLSWIYKNSCVYIYQNSKINGNIALANNDTEMVKLLYNGGEKVLTYKNDIVTIIKESTSFYLVQNVFGEQFYISKNDINDISSYTEIPDVSVSNKIEATYNSPMNISWSKLKHAPDPIQGLDVLVNVTINAYAENTGNVKQTCDYGFIQCAHDNGYKVWICCMNGFSTSAKSYISSNLASENARNRTIAQYLFYAMIYNADGISLDYESMSYTNGKDKTNFEALVEKLCYFCDKLGLTTSVATYYGNSYNNSHMYDYAFLGSHADYLLEMTYGQNYAYSLSNMSKTYWQTGTDYIASLTDPKKVIMGVAYHMRYTVWDDNGNLLKSSKPTMNQIMTELIANNIPYTWDEYTGQYYAEEYYVSQDQTISGLARYYLEEERSAALKAQYIKDKGYGGTIGWEYSYNTYEGSEKVYQAYYNIYNGLKTYQDYVPIVEPVGPTPPLHDASGKIIINSKTVTDTEDENGNSDEYHEND